MIATLRVFLLFVAVAPAVRVAMKRPVWNELRTRPLLAVAMLGALGAAAILLVRVGAQGEIGLWVVTVGAAASALLAYIHARPSFGKRRGFPPGSLGIATSLDAVANEDFYARSAERWGPIFKMSQFHRPVVCIVDLPLGLDVLEQQRANLAQPQLPFGRLSPGNYIEFMNDERHARHRGILRTALSGRVLADCREGVEEVVREQLATITGRDRGAGVDPEDFLKRVELVSMLRVMFGITVHDPRIDELQRLFDDLGSSRAFAERRPEERVATFARLTRIFREVGEEISRRQIGGESPEHSVFSEILRNDPAHLADDTLVGNLVLIVHVTRSNVRGLLGWVMKEYIDHDQVALELRQAGDGTVEGQARVGALATNFVNETLRMHQSEYFYREVVRDTQIGAYRVPKGWLLRVCVRECHDNASVFPDPKTFNPGRFNGRHYDKTEYCPFSDGTHSCFGAGLAVMIARALVTVLAVDFDGRCVADGPVERWGNRHWSHWRPNTKFRISLSRRNGTAVPTPDSRLVAEMLDHPPGSGGSLR